MNIFEKRPLGLILCIILGGFSLFAVANTALRILLILTALILFFTTLFVKSIRKNTIFHVCASMLIVSFLLSFLYFDFIFYPDEYYGKETEIYGEVTDIKKISEYKTAYDVKCDKFDGNNVSYKIKLYLYGDAEGIEAGSKIKFSAELEEFDSDGSFNFKTYYTARGFSATASVSEVEIVSMQDAPLLYKFSQMRSALHERAAAISNEDAASLLSALLLGERDMLNGQITLDFSRIGITHLLALSGMHIAILYMLIEKLLKLFRIKSAIRIPVECILCFVFMALTGFPLSVCRAGIMMIISSSLCLLSGNKDGYTSLFVAFLIIVILTPYAALDIGLWLSVVATLGILMASEILHEKYNERHGIYRYISAVTTSLLFSLFAVSATSAITALTFGSVSIISIFTTLIFSLLTELYLYLGIFILIFGTIIPAGEALVLFEKLISEFAAAISEFPAICASTSYISVKVIFVLLTLLFAGFAVLKIKNKKRAIAVICAAYAFANAYTVAITEINMSADAFISVSDLSDKIIIKDDGNALLFENSACKKSEAYDSLSLLSDEGITELDTYFVASYSDILPLSIPVVLSRIRTENLLLPMPQNSDEERVAIEIFAAASSFRVNIEFYDDHELYEFSTYEIYVPHRAIYSNVLTAAFIKADSQISYFSSGALEYSPESYSLLFASDTVIFGTYGKDYTSSILIDEYSDRLSYVISHDSYIYIGKSDEVEKMPKVSFKTKNRLN